VGGPQPTPLPTSGAAPTALTAPPPPPPPEYSYGTSPPPAAPPAPPRRRRPRWLASGGFPRLVLTLVLIVGFILAAISLGTAWWAYSSSTGGSSESVQFGPGSTYSVTCSGSGCGNFASGSFSYSSFGGSIGSLYGTLEALLILAVVLAGIATLFGLVALAGRGGRMFGLLGFLLGLASGAVLILLGVWIESSQPGSFGSGVAFPGTRVGGASPSTSFWGAASNGGAVASWGAGAGWYCAVIGGVLVLAVAVALLFIGRESTPRAARTPRAPKEDRAFAPVPTGYRDFANRPVYAPPVHSTMTAPPSASASVHSPVQATAKSPAPVLGKKATAPSATVECPACGYANAPKARICAYCQRPMKVA
jgi:hypothetical protein